MKFSNFSKVFWDMVGWDFSADLFSEAKSLQLDMIRFIRVCKSEWTCSGGSCLCDLFGENLEKLNFVCCGGIFSRDLGFITFIGEFKCFLNFRRCWSYLYCIERISSIALS